jgi:hypothetical protein
MRDIPSAIFNTARICLQVTQMLTTCSTNIIELKMIDNVVSVDILVSLGRIRIGDGACGMMALSGRGEGRADAGARIVRADKTRQAYVRSLIVRNLRPVLHTEAGDYVCRAVWLCSDSSVCPKHRPHIARSTSTSAVRERRNSRPRIVKRKANGGLCRNSETTRRLRFRRIRCEKRLLGDRSSTSTT